MPRTLDLNNGRDSWIAVNDLTANVEFSDEAVGLVDWVKEARKRGNVYTGMRDNRRARFPSAPKPTCAKQFYDVARPGIGRDGRDVTSRRGFAFQQQPRKQCSGGKWWAIVGENKRTVRYVHENRATEGHPNTPIMNKILDKTHNTDTAHKMTVSTRAARAKAAAAPQRYNTQPRFYVRPGENSALCGTRAFHKFEPPIEALNAVRPHSAPCGVFSTAPTGRGAAGSGDDGGEFVDGNNDRARARARIRARGNDDMTWSPVPPDGDKASGDNDGAGPGNGKQRGAASPTTREPAEIMLGLRPQAVAFTFATAARGDADPVTRALAARVGCSGTTAESAQMLPNHQFAEDDRVRASTGKLGAYMDLDSAQRASTVGRTFPPRGFDPFSVRAWAEVAERCQHDVDRPLDACHAACRPTQRGAESAFKNAQPRLAPDAASATSGNSALGPGYADAPSSVAVQEPERPSSSFCNDGRGRKSIRADMRLYDGMCDSLRPRFERLPREERYGCAVPGATDRRDRVDQSMTFKPKLNKGWYRLENGIKKPPRRGPHKKYRRPWTERPTRARGGAHIPKFD